MPICSYVVFPQPGRAEALTRTLKSIPGCDPLPASNRDLLLLATDTADSAEEQALQQKLQALEDIQCMVLSFGEINPDSTTGGTGAFGKSKKFS